MSVSASLVKELRERTGAGMMECKKALQEVNGDIEAGIELMRKSGQAKAAKKAGRIAAEGLIVIQASTDAAAMALVEVNCETDFVAKDENFRSFADAVAKCILNSSCTTVEELLASPLSSTTPITVQESLEALVLKLGENMRVRRYARLTASVGKLFSYRHGTRIGVIVEVVGGDESLGKDLAMHIAASNPVCVTSQQVPVEAVVKEREIFMAQAVMEAEKEGSGKPQHVVNMIIEKKVEGRVRKFLNEVSLLGQPFVRDQKITVEQLLQQHGAQVHQFRRMEVGEGLEKKKEDFAAEVAAAKLT